MCQSLLKFIHLESVRLSNHHILCHLLLLWPSIFPSIRIFSNESAVEIRWPKYWSFSISPSNDYSELISFMIDWLDVHTVQGTLKSALEAVLRPYLPPILKAPMIPPVFCFQKKILLEGPLFEKAQRLLGSSHSHLWI